MVRLWILSWRDFFLVSLLHRLALPDFVAVVAEFFGESWRAAPGDIPRLVLEVVQDQSTLASNDTRQV